MRKIFTKSLFLIAAVTIFIYGDAFAQAITLGNVDTGPYAPGSTITVPVSITGTCVKTTTTYNLYLSNAAGSFAAQKLIGTFANFYATFINGLIPAGTPAGNGYVVKVVSVNPAVTSTVSAPFSIVAGAGVVAALGSQLISPTYPEVFGTCSGVNNTSYSFVDKSTAGAAVKATFFNELSKASEGTITPTVAGVVFKAKAAHYTITVKAVNNGIVGTKSYFLINNVVNTSFGVTGSNTICLNGGGALTYNVDISSSSGIQNNFPGLIYSIHWGDNTVSSLTLCDILAGGGQISHNYTQSSCGNNPNGQHNSFEVDLQPSDVYCGKVGTQVTSYAQVITAPVNSFTCPVAACTGNSVTFTNTSDPGQNPNSVSGNCQSTNALYTWIVDGVTAVSNYDISQSFTTTFNKTGTHTITLHLQNGNALCAAHDTTIQLCIQNPPKPKFTFPAATVCAPATVVPVNQSVIDANCNAGNKYVWTVTGPAAVSYANGTSKNSATPGFIFKSPGVYQVSLGITTVSCGTVTTPVQSITVDSAIVIKLSPDITFCGSNQTLSFSPAAGPSQTIISGTVQQQASTYTWVVTGGPYSFAAGTSANSQYPQITFTGFASYNISVTVKNSCGTLTKSQNLTFQDAPQLSITPSSTSICPQSSVTLKGSITGKYTSYSWISQGSGKFSSQGLTTVYTPGAAEINSGSATITLDVKTALAAPCADVQQNITINIFPVNTITSAQSLQVCNGQAVNYNITSGVPGSTFSWTAALASGTASGFTKGNGASINNVLINNSLSDATVNYTITPQANGCNGAPFVLAVTVKPQSTVTATPVSGTICSGSTAAINLTPNIAGAEYTWTSTATGSVTGNSSQVTEAGATAINDVLNNNGAATGTVKYTITPYNGACPGPPVTIIISVQPLAVPSNPGANDEVCNSTSYTLNGNNPSPGAGKWTVSPAGTVKFDDDTKPTATATGLIPGTTYTFTWTITPQAPCAPNSNSVVIIDDALSNGGVTSGNATVCAGSNSGAITLSGQVGKVLRWESSTNNWTTPPGQIPNTGLSQSYLNLTQTTQYRAVVQNGSCSMQYSTVATVTVNQPAIQAIAGADQNLCGATSATLQGNDPAPFSGKWQQVAGPAANILSPNSAQTKVTGLIQGSDYTFLWTIKGISPCSDNSDSTHIHNANDVIAGFKADKTDGCGAYTVNFSNTSSVLAGTSFLWYFGDGGSSTDVSPSHTFAARADGRDTTYIVSLYVVNNCVQRPPDTLKVIVRPQTPVAYIAPRQITGCAPFTLAVDNLSPGNNQSYTFYLYNNSNGTLVQKITKTDKSTVTFNPINTNTTIQYTLYMVATGFCGNTGQSSVIPITTSASSIVSQMFIENGATKGCAPFTATFINNSVGGDRYQYNIYNATLTDTIDRVSGGTAPLAYEFDTPGTYFVSITTLNSCTNLESAKVRVDVYPIPTPDFMADITTGCKDITVNFTNQTPDDPTIKAASLTYDWNLDGKDYFTLTPPPHAFNYRNSPYTITLTATNPVTGCSNVIKKVAYINVSAPPATQFTEKPDSITSIPNYSFSFIDETTGGPVLWSWSFGDKGVSANQNPEHTYADTGVYKVTLTTVSAQGCDSAVTHYVRVTGVPGQLFLPNAFEPDGGATELKTFMAKGSGIKQWHLQIFNNYSQLIWETTKLDDKGAPVDGWDGTFKGAPMPQGVYVWQASATFINGTEWKGNVINNSLPKRVGTIHLIR